VDRRAEIEGWIAGTRRTQRRLAIVMAGGAVVAIGLMLWNTSVGGIALGIVAIVALCGFWVTGSHLADWDDKLEQLDRPLRTVGRRAE
jgi:Flp pilus assembly protein TadB